MSDMLTYATLRTFGPADGLITLILQLGLGCLYAHNFAANQATGRKPFRAIRKLFLQAYISSTV